MRSRRTRESCRRGGDSISQAKIAAFKDYFSHGAAGYAAYRPSYPRELGGYLARLCRHRALAWDCGCGSGQLARLLADHFARVIATDASARQIEAASAHPAIDFRCAAAENSGLVAGSVDLVAAAQAAHWFDLSAFYAEARRVARPGAIIVLVSYGLVTVDNAVDAVIKPFYSEVLGPYWPPERRHVETGYRSLLFPFNEIDAPDFQIRTTWMLSDLLGYIGTWSAVRRLRRSRGDSAISTFQDGLAEIWGEASAVRSVRWPLALRIGRIP